MASYFEQIAIKRLDAILDRLDDLQARLPERTPTPAPEDQTRLDHSRTPLQRAAADAGNAPE